MSLDLLARGTATTESVDLNAFLLQPQFRKTTRCMALGTLAIQQTLSAVEGLFAEQKKNFGLVIASDTGELETTVDFLKTLNETGVARPLLFQNSLHNATAGFLAIHFGITGPVVTTSGFPHTPERGMEMAELLLSSRQCDYCLVLSVNVWSFLRASLPELEIPIDAAAALLLRRGSDEAGGPRALTTISEIKISQPSTEPKSWRAQSLEQNLIYRLAIDHAGER